MKVSAFTTPMTEIKSLELFSSTPQQLCVTPRHCQETARVLLRVVPLGAIPTSPVSSFAPVAATNANIANNAAAGLGGGAQPSVSPSGSTSPQQLQSPTSITDVPDVWLVSVQMGANYEELLAKLLEIVEKKGVVQANLGTIWTIKYVLPGYHTPAPLLVDVVNDDDVVAMWEELEVYQKSVGRQAATFKLSVYLAEKLPQAMPVSLQTALITPTGSTAGHTLRAADDGPGNAGPLSNGGPGSVSTTSRAAESMSDYQPQSPAGSVCSTEENYRVGSSQRRSSHMATSMDYSRRGRRTSVCSEGSTDLSTELQYNKLQIISPQEIRLLKRLTPSEPYHRLLATEWLGKWSDVDVNITIISLRSFVAGGHNIALEDLDTEALYCEWVYESSILAGYRHPNLKSLYGIVVPLQDTGAQGVVKPKFMDLCQEVAEPGSMDLQPEGGSGQQDSLEIHPFALVFEYVSGNTLHEALHSRAPWLESAENKVRLALDCSKALQYLHSKDEVHMLVRPAYLYISMRTPRHPPLLKVGHFGYKRQKLNCVSRYLEEIAHLSWLPPELVTQRGDPSVLGPALDVYGFGMTLWKIWTRALPFSEFRTAEQLVDAWMRNPDLRPPLPDESENPAPCAGWSGLLQECWATDPAARPPFVQITERMTDMLAHLRMLSKQASAPM